MKYEYNIVAIGAGSAGLVSAYISAAINAKVALIERHKMGGDCLNTGCVPSKALIRTAHFLADVKRHEQLGVKTASAEVDFAQVMERVSRVIKKVEPHDSVERYTELGVDIIIGEAMIKSPHEIEVNGKTLTTKNIVIATGAKPFVPSIPGIESIDYLHTDNVWEIRKQPEKLVILGGGPIGSELSQAFNRIGVNVTQIEKSDQILTREDPEVSAILTRRFTDEGIDLRLSSTAKEIKTEGDRKYVVIEKRDGSTEDIEFDQLLCALGRRPNVTGFGLEEVGVKLDERGRVAIDSYGRTSVPNIFACGDVTSPYQFTHMAAHGAYYAVVNALFAGVPFAKQKINLSAVPWCTFTDPEIARVGLNEKDAKREGIPYEVTTYGINDLDRAIADDEDHGLVRILTVPGKDKILGVTICGADAGNIIPEFVLAKNYGMGLGKIMGTIHIYPTMGEANKYAAGNWKKAHKPQGILRLLNKFHAWRRG